MQQKRKG